MAKVKFSQGTYKPINASKYIGKGYPKWRSSWENQFFKFCDSNPSVIAWAVESIHIQYIHPLTGKRSTYIPDIFMRYRDKNGVEHTEIIEIKPLSQTVLTEKSNRADRIAIAINTAKWQAATQWCKNAGIVFRVLTEKELFHTGSKR